MTSKSPKNKKYNVILLAPAGSFACLTAAINAGCNAVYFGVNKLNMRVHSSKNFKLEDLKKVAKICRDNNVRSYLTLNSILYDSDIKVAKQIIDKAEEAKVNGIIAQDLAVITYAKEKGVEVTISTQLSISNLDAVKFYSKWADRITLARELDLRKIKYICGEIKKQKIKGPKGRLVEIEIFIHGAMCVAISGRCGMSLLTTNYSANRGQCLQPCRRTYKVIDTETNQALKIKNQFVMSPEDLCTIGFLDEILDTGAKVLKIEGRARSPEYIDRVVRIYRQAIDSINSGTYTKDNMKKWNKDLKTVYNRGLSDGYYLGKKFREWSGIYGSKATKKKEFLGNVKKYYPKISVVELKLQTRSISQGDEYLIIGDKTGVVRGKTPKILLNEKEIRIAKKGDLITFKVKGKTREGDKVYKVIDKNN